MLNRECCWPPVISGGPVKMRLGLFKNDFCNWTRCLISHFVAGDMADFSITKIQHPNCQIVSDQMAEVGKCVQGDAALRQLNVTHRSRNEAKPLAPIQIFFCPLCY